MMSTQAIQPWLDGQALPYAYHARTVALASALAIHAQGLVPKADLQRRRPGEDEMVQQYRHQIFQPITQAPFGRVLNTLSAIRRAPRFGLWYPPSHASILPEESLEAYCSAHYPWHGDVQEWFFQLGLRQMLVDPNALVVVLPREFVEGTDATEAEYRKPYGYLIPSVQVLDYREGEWAVVRDNRKSWVTDRGKDSQTGEVLWFISLNEVTIAEQYGEARERQFRLRSYANYSLHWPVFRLGGPMAQFGADGVLYDSFLAPALPYWQEATRLYSDLQAVMVLHAYPEKITYQNEDCRTCNGTGYQTQADGRAACATCNGTGYQRPSPYGVTVVRPPMSGEPNLPWPSTVYVQKDTAIIRLLKDEVEDNLYKAYEALGLDFLASTPLNQSGRAKELDRQEVNKFLFGVAKHSLTYVLTHLVEAINAWRYPLLSLQDRKAQLPIVHVPESFDVMTEEHLAAEIAQATTAGVAIQSLQNLQVEYARRKFGQTHPAWKELSLLQRLDPLIGLNVNEKLALVQSGLLTTAEVQLSLRLPRLVKDLLAQYPDAIDWPAEKLREVLALTEPQNIVTAS